MLLINSANEADFLGDRIRVVHCQGDITSKTVALVVGVSLFSRHNEGSLKAGFEAHLLPEVPGIERLTADQECVHTCRALRQELEKYQGALAAAKTLEKLVATR